MGRLSDFRQRLADVKEDPAEPQLTDPWAYVEELGPVAAAIEAGDWPTLRAMLRERSDPDDASFLGHHIGDVDGIEHLLAAAVEEDPSDMDALALLGGRTITLGWEIRGHGRANTVSEQQFEAFHDHVQRGDAMLTEAAANDPANVHAAKWRVTAARALSMGQNETRRRYAQFAAHQPHSLSVQSQVLQGVVPKWGGDWDGAWRFVSDAVDATPPGAATGTLVVDYHLERWLDHEDERNPYWKQDEVRVQLGAAADRSILHPDHRRGLNWVDTHNTFVGPLCLAEDWPRAAVIFERLENRYDEDSWAYFSDGELLYRSWKNKARRLAHQ